MPGFIASNYDNVVTTLGRNGSDYSAAIVANAVNADVLKMWKDVDGLYSADPKLIVFIQQHSDNNIITKAI